jgi:hypothetical protein
MFSTITSVRQIQAAGRLALAGIRGGEANQGALGEARC